MKKLFIFMFALFLISGGAMAQKGDLLLSGNLSFNYSGADIIDGNKNGRSSMTFEAGPSLLYGFSEKFYFGGEISANLYNYRDYDAGTKTLSGYKNMFGIAPMVRCYAYRNKLIGFFTDTKVGIYFGRDKEKTNYTAVKAGITPGIEFFLGQHFSLSASLNDVLSFSYEYANPKGDNNSTEKTDLSFIFSPMEMNYAPLTLSVSYHFR